MICFESYGGLKLLQIGPDDLFFYPRPLQGYPEPSNDGFRGVSEWFQRGLKFTFFLKEGSRNGRMIRFESYGGLKLPQIGPDDLFFYPRPLQGHPEPSNDGFRGVSEWFQRGLKFTFFLKEGSRNGRMIRFESYGGLKLPQIGPEGMFFYIWHLQGHPEPFSDGFRGVSEGFQKPRGFRVVSEGSETVWFQSGFRGSETAWFQSGFRGSETAWFQRGFRGV